MRRESRQQRRTRTESAIESLEPRRMLATYSGTAGNDVIAITTASFFHRVTINGVINTTSDSTVTINALDGNDTINVTDTLTGSIVVVNGGNGDDFLQNIGRDLDDTYASFLFAGGTGADRIVADNSGDDDSARTFRIEADRLVREDDNRILLTYSGLEVFGYADTEFANTIRLANLQTASRNVQDLQVLGNGGDDFIRNDTSQYWGTTFGTGLAQIVGGPGNDSVDLFNTNATVPATYTMDATSLDVSSSQFNTGTVTFTTCEGVTIHGSAQNETFLLNAQPAGLNVRFNGNNGDDAFTVGGGDLDSNGLLTATNTVNADGGGGTDSITFNDQLDAEGESENCILDSFSPSVNRIIKGNQGFYYAGFETQTLNAGDRVNSVSGPNSIVIVSAPGGTAPTTINGGANRDCDVSLGNGFAFDFAPVTANLQGGTIRFGDNDNPRVYRLTQTQLVTPKLINYSGVDTIFIDGADNIGDDFFIEGVPSGTAVSIAGKVGDDRLTLGTGNIDATILGPVTFDGGAGPDRVTIDNSQDTTVESHVLNGATFTDGQTHSFTTDELIINEGPGGTNFSVNGTTVTDSVTINGGNASETFLVGGGDINSNLPLATLFLRGFGGSDEILFNDLNDNTLDSYTLFSNGVDDALVKQLAGATTAAIFWNGIESATLDASNAATFAGSPTIIEVLNPVTPLRIRGNAGSDRIIVNDTTAPLFVHTGAGDSDSLIVNNDFGSGDEPAVITIDQTDDVETLDIKRGGTVRLQPNVVLVKTRLSSPIGVLFIGGVLDVAGGAFLSTAGGPSPEIFRGMLADGYNSGTWNGTSTTGAINSSLASATSKSDGVGHGTGSEIAVASIGPFAIAAGDTLIRYTLDGDADLNQSVNIADFSRLAANFNGTSKVWTTGDSNYDNVTSINDFAGLASNFNQSVPAALPRMFAPANLSPFASRVIGELDELLS